MSISEYLNVALNVGNSFGKYFLKVSLIVVFLLVGCIISRTVGKIVKKLFSTLAFNEVTTKTGQKISVGFIVSSSVEVLGYLITLIFALNEIGLENKTVQIFFICLIVIAVLAILNIALLGMNSFVPNFVAGVSILVRNKIRKGMIIEIGEHKGEVMSVNLLEIVLKNHKDETIYVPNSRIFSNDVVIHHHVLHRKLHDNLHHIINHKK